MTDGECGIAYLFAVFVLTMMTVASIEIFFRGDPLNQQNK